jgi:uncharacterized protein (DUF1330 family)
MPWRPTRTGARSASLSPNSRASSRRPAAYDSPAYQDALKALGDGAVRDVRIIEGME